MRMHIFEIVLVILVLLFVFSQIMLPAVRGTRLLPFFRREGKIRDDMIDAQQEAHNATLQEQLDAFKTHQTKDDKEPQ